MYGPVLTLEVSANPLSFDSSIQSTDRISAAKKKEGDTHSPDVAGFGGGGGEGAAGGTTGAAAACVAGGGADGAAASGGGISTCFQSCPSSTMRAMRVPRGTLRLPSSICTEGERVRDALTQ